MIPKVIIIGGLDGSGKTTLAKWIVKLLNKKGYKSKYVWMRSRHTFAFLLSKLLFSLGWNETIINPNGMKIIRFKIPETFIIKRIWSLIEFISILPLIFFKVKIPLFFGNIIVLDRYTVDTLASISVFTKSDDFTNGFFGKVLLKMIPEKSVMFFLYTNTPTQLKRRQDIEFTLEEIKNEFKTYVNLSNKLNANFIDTSNININEMNILARNIILNDYINLKNNFYYNDKMDYSIVIPTINRKNELQILLLSILNLEILPKKIIIVDQSTYKETSNMTHDINKKFIEKNIVLKYIHINNKNASLARNIGVSYITEQIVFFIDDDVILKKNYTKKILDVYKNYSDAIGVQGNLIMNPETIMKMYTFKGRFLNSLKKYLYLSHFKKNSWKVLSSINDIFPFPLLKTISTTRLQGCCSFKREIFDYFKYDENLTGWSFLEDFDLSHRVSSNMIGSLYITPQAILHHTHLEHTTYSKKIEYYKKILHRQYMFFKLIKPSFSNYLIFSWSLIWFAFTTTLAAIFSTNKNREKWIPIYIFNAIIYSIKHLKEIKKLDLNFIDEIM